MEKSVKDFSKSSRTGLQTKCKLCSSLYLKEYRLINKETLHLKSQEYKLLNKSKISSQKKEWQKNNSEKLSTYCNEYEKKRKKIDILFKLKKNIRSHLASAIKQNYKSGSAVSDLGCSIEELKLHLESLFEPGMTWENWSRTGWHIDHIIPLDAFNLSDPKQFKEACKYTNLQPLWAKDNLRKSNKYEK
jgi:hypothetical protein